MQTELELLEILIALEKSKEKFAEKVGMSRQNLNHLIRQFRANDGKLSDAFKLKLKGAGIDLYQYKRNPTNDTYQNVSQGMAAEEGHAYTESQRTIQALADKISSLSRDLNICQMEKEKLEQKVISMTLKKTRRKAS